MRLINKFKLGSLLAAFLVVLLPVQLVFAADDEQRAPPAARTAGTLSDAVMRAIGSIQEKMQPEDPDDEPDLVGAKAELDELYERRYERMNDFEKSTLLSFYTNYYLNTENYPDAIRIFEQTLTIETLREDVRLRTLRSLGQLEAAEEKWADSIKYYEQWRDIAPAEDDIVFRGLSYAHYQLEQFTEALPHWLSYMEMILLQGEELGRDDYAYLNGIYFILEDFDSALELTKTMIMLFDDPIDWLNLSAIYGSIEDYTHSVQSLNLSYLRGILDDDSRYINLAQSLTGIDMPYSGAKILQDGMDKQIVEADLDNLTTLTQMHLIASEYESAADPAKRVAELDDSGDGFDNLGYIYYMQADYEASVEALKQAVEKGGLKDSAGTLYTLARAHMELKNFDDALEAARDSADAGDDERARKNAQDFMKVIESRRTYYNTIASRKEEAIDFYESYPPLR
jgi:tetratricopeptide (TPR) repeat protein